MKNALIIGATGATGKYLMKYLIQSNIYKNIAVVHYKPTNLKSEKKVEEYIINFDKLKFSLKTNFKIDDVFCCIGTTRKKAGSAEKFKKVDFHYAMSIGEWSIENNVKQFNIISSSGANKSSPFLYMKTKGEIEEALKALNFRTLNIFRPPLLHASNRNDFRPGEDFFYYPLKLLSYLLPTYFKKYKPIEVEDLAKKIFEEAQKDNTGVSILEPNYLNQ